MHIMFVSLLTVPCSMLFALTVVSAAQYDYNPNEDYAETELKLREHLQSFLETVKSFNMIYTKVNILCNVM